MKKPIRLIIIVLVLALSFAWAAAKGISAKLRSSEQSESISLPDLISRGKRGNPNVIVKDFSMVDDVFYKKKLDGTWSAVWIPIVPAPSNQPQARVDQGGAKSEMGEPIPVVFIYCDKIHNQQQLVQFLENTTVRGQVSSDAPNPDDLGKDLISERFPTVGPDVRIIVHEGKVPEDLGRLAFYVIASLCLFAYALHLLFFARPKVAQAAKNPNDTQASALLSPDRYDSR